MMLSRRAATAALAMVLAGTAVAASSCSTPEAVTGQECGNGEGTWITDESESLKGGYTVIVSICVSHTGKILDLTVD